MPTVKHRGRSFKVHKDGHLKNPDDYGKVWRHYCLTVLNPLLIGADRIVAELNPNGDLTEQHYEVINKIREYYKNNQIIPLERILSKSSGIPIKRIYELFPVGTNRGVGKIAGIPSEVTHHLYW